jgi:tetratricopeptide (TPR) repeat protein
MRKIRSRAGAARAAPDDRSARVFVASPSTNGSASNREATSLYRAGDFDAALTAAEKGPLDLAEREFGPEHPDVALSLNTLALAYDAKGLPDEAEPLYERSYLNPRSGPSAGQPQCRRRLNNLAMHPSRPGPLRQAEPLYVRSLGIRERTLAPRRPGDRDEPKQPRGTLPGPREYAKAEPLYSRSLAIREKVLGPEHPSVATILNNIASCIGSRRVRPGVSALQAVDRNQGENLGADHPSVAISLNNLALQYHSQKRYAEAERLFVRARTIWERALGPDAPRCRREPGQPRRSVRGAAQIRAGGAAVRSVALDRRKGCGPDAPETARSHGGLAAFYRASGKPKKAAELEKLAAAVRGARR